MRVLGARTVTLAVAAGLLGVTASPVGAARLSADSSLNYDFGPASGEGDHQFTVTQGAQDITFADTFPLTVTGDGASFCSLAAGGLSATCPRAFRPGQGGLSEVSVFGGPGNDTIRLAGDQEDIVADGLEGDDRIIGSPGDDIFTDGLEDPFGMIDDGSDDYQGGAGFDTFAVRYGQDAPVHISLDDVADDGDEPQTDNVHSDVEDIIGADEPDTFTGSAASNVIDGGLGSDVIDGGAGSDILLGGPGDDRIVARDGERDRVDCGIGTDTAVVDAVDDLTGCETVDRPAGPAPAPPVDDRPPVVSFASPAAGSVVPARGATVMVSASDDLGLQRVELLDDGRVVGHADRAPYAISLRPTGADPGRNTLQAIAIDSSGQTTSVTRLIRVGRFTPRRLTLHTARRAGRVRVSGTLLLPAGVTRAQGCSSGSVTVRVGSRRTTAPLRRDCSWRTSVAARGRVTATFTANKVLATRRAS